MSDKESRTERESVIEEAATGDHHYKTTITDGHEKAVGRGRTSEEAEKSASDKWDSGETSSSGGCVISTACIESQGLSDDCEELNQLRQFRDDFVSRLPNGNELIREYNEVAPRIVSAINGTEKSKEIYSELFEELVTRTVHLINTGHKQEALGNCISVIKELEQRFGH
jgi:hypothetical protein